MSNPVEFRLALSNSFPTGTGSFGYNGSFQIMVQNLAYEKQVAIWAQIGANWQDIPASYVESLPGGLERWRAPASNNENQFVAKYTVNGTTHWDNNAGANYPFPRAFDEFSALSGINYKVVLGTASIAGGNLHISTAVQNLAFTKVVGAVFTTDNWATVQTALGNFAWTMSSGLEVWAIDAPVGTASEVKFALFYRVLGGEFWDNNFWRNYTVTPATPIFARHTALPDEDELWLSGPKRETPEASPEAFARGVKPLESQPTLNRRSRAPAPKSM